MLKHQSGISQLGRAKPAKMWASILVKFLPTLLVLGILGLGWLAIHEITSEVASSRIDQPSDIESRQQGIVYLTNAKLEAVAIHCSPVEEQWIEPRHEVPGRIQYDGSRHVEVRASMEGVLAELFVKPGDKVASDQLLAVVKSPEIGMARSEVLKRLKELEIAEQKLNRERELSNNLYAFYDQLDQGQEGSLIDEAFADRPLGNFRRELLSAYAQLNLARSLIDKGKSLGDAGAISGRTVREREAELAIAIAAFRTIRDQSEFAARQAKLQAEADVEDARRQYDIAKQILEGLLGYPENVSAVNSNDALSRMEIHSPIAGTVESRLRSPGERISKYDTLMVLADTDVLYVAADIRETDWMAVAVKPGTMLSVTVPALENRKLPASVHYIGREVTVDSNSIPMIATIDNAEGWLRPGMFVRVSIPVGAPRRAVAVNSEAIVQHDEKKFVFIETGERVFERVDIVTGLDSNEWVEVKAGLSIGQKVVDRGAFLLKSELLLEGESE